jgi:hypothetical protein
MNFTEIYSQIGPLSSDTSNLEKVQLFTSRSCSFVARWPGVLNKIQEGFVSFYS